MLRPSGTLDTEVALPRLIKTRRDLPNDAGPQNKRMRTRARLKEAALEVIAQRGVFATSVSEIAIAADVANGTFYLHFQDKNEIVAAVCHGVTKAMHDEMSRGLDAIEDGAARVVFATQQFIEIAASEPLWGQLLVRAFSEFGSIKADISRFMRADVELGVAQGRFPGPSSEFLIDCLLNLLRAGIEARLSGAPAEVSDQTAVYMLRCLGMDPAEVSRVRAVVAEVILKAER